MMLTKKQLEFWTMILAMCIGVAVLITLVDFGIKAAILEESTRLRIKIEDWEIANGRCAKETDTSGTDNDAPIDSDIPGGLLVVKPAGMETENVPNGATSKAYTARKGKSQPSRPSDVGAIQDGNEQVG